MTEKYQENDVILCKVTNIVRTTVFVETLDKIKGSIVMSEIAPGRIRNLREYVVLNKIIACKILHIKDDYLFLSLRRVKTDERKKLMEQYKKEKTFMSVLKKICGEEKAKDAIKKIQKENSLTDFLESARQNNKLLKKYFTDSQIEKIIKIIEVKKEKIKSIKREFKLFSKASNGIKLLKQILSDSKNISYLGNSKFQIKISSKNLKQADKEISLELNKIEKSAKKNKCEFEIKK
ncbi:MAG: hypothetical protein U9Q06_03685 [Nanoarchaeota archaeon]|nr:hypothetical protein [Nanoarchaeota archaeon]